MKKIITVITIMTCAAVLFATPVAAVPYTYTVSVDLDWSSISIGGSDANHADVSLTIHDIPTFFSEPIPNHTDTQYDGLVGLCYGSITLTSDAAAETYDIYGSGSWVVLKNSIDTPSWPDEIMLSGVFMYGAFLAGIEFPDDTFYTQDVSTPVTHKPFTPEDIHEIDQFSIEGAMTQLAYGDTGSASASPVPEPTTMLLFGAGLVGLAGFGRKKFKK